MEKRKRRKEEEKKVREKIKIKGKQNAIGARLFWDVGVFALFAVGGACFFFFLS